MFIFHQMQNQNLIKCDVRKTEKIVLSNNLYGIFLESNEKIRYDIHLSPFALQVDDKNAAKVIFIA